MHRLKLFWEVSRPDERPAFANKAYTKDGAGITTDKRCKKERRHISRQEKKKKPSMAMAKSKGALEFETARHDKMRSKTLRE